MLLACFFFSFFFCFTIRKYIYKWNGLILLLFFAINLGHFFFFFRFHEHNTISGLCSDLILNLYICFSLWVVHYFFIAPLSGFFVAVCLQFFDWKEWEIEGEGEKEKKLVACWVLSLNWESTTSLTFQVAFVFVGFVPLYYYISLPFGKVFFHFVICLFTIFFVGFCFIRIDVIVLGIKCTGHLSFALLITNWKFRRLFAMSYKKIVLDCSSFWSFKQTAWYDFKWMGENGNGT